MGKVMTDCNRVLEGMHSRINTVFSPSFEKGERTCSDITDSAWSDESHHAHQSEALQVIVKCNPS